MHESCSHRRQVFSVSGRICRHAFTLVELLVVIGIVAVLISMLLLTLLRARESAKPTKCLSNLRSLSQSTLMFAGDNKGKMPGRAGNSVLMWDSGTNRLRNASGAESEA